MEGHRLFSRSEWHWAAEEKIFSLQDKRYSVQHGGPEMTSAGKVVRPSKVPVL